jgi:hypothetical protein
LKKLRAGLTTDEIEKLVAQLKFDGRDIAISSEDFENLVVLGA